MPNKSFFWFFLPTGLAMILFIGLPIISTGIQSFYSQHDQILKEVKKCDPFGCVVSVQIDQEETLKIKEETSHLENLMDLEHMLIEII